MKYVTELPSGEAFVAMVEFRGAVIVASTKGIYKLVDEKLVKIPIIMEKENE